jgi:hypothetical protein
LGLLAVAAGSLIHVFALPDAAEFRRHHGLADGGGGNSSSLPVAAAVPLATLECGAAAVVDLAWSTDAEHRRIGAAMADGSFALFDVGTASMGRPRSGSGAGAGAGGVSATYASTTPAPSAPMEGMLADGMQIDGLGSEWVSARPRTTSVVMRPVAVVQTQEGSLRSIVWAGERSAISPGCPPVSRYASWPRRLNRLGLGGAIADPLWKKVGLFD